MFWLSKIHFSFPQIGNLHGIGKITYKLWHYSMGTLLWSLRGGNKWRQRALVSGFGEKAYESLRVSKKIFRALQPCLTLTIGGQENSKALSLLFTPFNFFEGFIFIYLFLQKGKGREKERNINMWFSLMRPLLGTWPTTQACSLTRNQTGRTLWFTGQHSIHWATSARAKALCKGANSY